MGKYSIWLGILFILIGSIGIYLYQHKDAFKKSPFESDVSFVDVSHATADDQQNVYVINDDKQRIVKLNSAGTVQFEVMETPSKKFSYQYTDISVDQTGKLYVTKVDFLPYSDEVKAESILRYHADGTFDKVLQSFDYSKEKVETPRLKNIRIQQDNLYFLSLKGQEVTLQTMHLTSGVTQTNFVSKLPKNHYIYEPVIGINETIIYSTKQGEVYTLSRGKSKKIFMSEEEEIGRGVLEGLYYGIENDVYVIDQHHNEIDHLLVDYSSETIFLNKDKIEAQGYSFSLDSLINISLSNQGMIILTQPNRVIVLDQLGNVEAVHERGFYSQEDTLFQWWIWVLPFLLIMLSIYTAWYVYRYIMKRKSSLIVKQILVFGLLLSIAMGLSSYILYHNFTKKLEKETVQKNTVIANVVEKRIDGDILQQITSPKDYMNKEFLLIQNSIDGLTKDLHSRIYKYDQGKLYAILSEQHVIFAPIAITSDMEAVLEGKQVTVQTENGQQGFTVLRPLYNSSGKIIGIFELSDDKNIFLKDTDEYLSALTKYLILIAMVVFLLFSVITMYMLYPIRALSRSVSEISKGKWETVATIHSSDEVAVLSDEVNRMSEHVRNYTEKMTDLNQAYYRFVPRQFLQYLGKETVLDLRLGDQTEQEKTIFVLKMRSFFSFSKHLTSEENFKFINSFLSRFGSIIQRNDGFINKYMGAGALSFFSEDSKKALESAIQVRKELADYNIKRGKKNYAPVDIGIGIHKGSVMLGVIGEKDRLEGAAISDHVNLTEMLEELSSSLEVSILVTQSVIDDISDSKDYRYRDLGMVNVTNRNEPIRLYDVYQGDSKEVHKLKEDTKMMFENGVMLYQDGRFFDARTNFIEVIKKNPYDKTAKLYFYLCDEFYQHGTPRDWNGTLQIK